LQGLFMHIPGLKLIMPSSCYDAKGLLLAAIADPNPVIIMEHRLNFQQKGRVPPEIYRVPIGKGEVKRTGRDVTVVATSHQVLEVFNLGQELAGEGIEVEVIDPLTLRPLDTEIILSSVARTGRLVVVDTGWKTAGVGAEIGAMVAEQAFPYLKAPIKRVAAPDLPTPAGFTLEEAFYTTQEDIKKAICAVVNYRPPSPASKILS
jgi:pyruvate/2-oxoglutarate/acetoin dehydrogenase E1 component